MVNDTAGCKQRVEKLGSISKKLDIIMSSLDPEYQLNIKFKILQAKSDLYQIYNESYSGELVGHSIVGHALLDHQFIFKEIDSFLDELNTVLKNHK